MDLYIKDKNLHHAYCIVGNADEIVSELENFLKKELGFKTEGNPDFWRGVYDVMDIEDSRTIKNLHGNKPVLSDKKIFIVSANFITEKAQNAMLKLFEEPRGDTHFFLIIPSANGLIATLKSRMNIIEHSGKSDSAIDVKKFIKMPMGEKMEEIKNLMESITDEEKSKIEVSKFINALESELKNKTDFSKEGKSKTEMFERMEKVRQYASEQSPSLKMLLEYLALVLPAE